MRVTSRQRLGSAIGLALAGTLLLALPRPGDEAAALGAAGLLTALGFACWALAGALIIDEPPRVALGLSRPSSFGPTAALLAILGCLGLSQLLAQATAGGFAPVTVPAAARVAADASPSELVALVLGAAFAPAVAEEVLFRGVLLRALLRRLRPSLAVGASTLVFAIAHLRSGSAIAAVGLGLYLALVVRASGGVRVAIACHAANNLFVLAVAALPDHAASAELIALWRLACGAGLVLTLVSLARATRGRRADGVRAAAG